jgi:ketosteroid isomerase-like protein
MNDSDAILAANAAFYGAFSKGDLGAMARVWADGDDISCIHPGWPAIVGRMAVLGSWRDIFRSGGRPDIVCREPHPLVTGDEGRVLCIELLDSSSALAASNHFRRIDGAWRLVHHQASAIARLPQVSPVPPSSNRIH